jgi:hypothetical protein
MTTRDTKDKVEQPSEERYIYIKVQKESTPIQKELREEKLRSFVLRPTLEDDNNDNKYTSQSYLGQGKVKVVKRVLF